MNSLSLLLPFRIRLVLLIGLVFILAGGAFAAYSYYTRPATLKVAVGSLDGETGRMATIIANHVSTASSPVRLEVVHTGNVLDAADAFAAGQADLAVVRADVGDLTGARSIAVVNHGVVMLVAPPGSPLTSIEKLKGHTVGVVGGEINRKVVDALTNEYDLKRGNVTFKDISPAETRQAIDSKQVSAILVVIPLTEKYLSLVKSLFRDGPNSSPVLIPIDSAGAIADATRVYESFDIPKGTLRGAPPDPADDLTTLRVGFYLVANKKLDVDVAANLTQAVMRARRDLVGTQPILSGISEPDLDPDAFITVHPGAAAYYNGTRQSFMDKYGNDIYLAPIAFGILASVFAGVLKFLEIGRREATEAWLHTLYHLPRRIRNAQSEAELVAIEEEVDDILKAQLAKARGGEQSALDIMTLHSEANRLDNLIHHRRSMLVGKPGLA
jgi:TRAP-type uncharacterized transport system substrate-binding protein